MKTPNYTKRAQKAFRNRKLQQGWKYFSILAPADIVEKLRKSYKELINNYEN